MVLPDVAYNLSPQRTKFNHLYDIINLADIPTGKEIAIQTQNSYLGSKSEVDKLQVLLKKREYEIETVQKRLKPFRQIKIVKSNQNLPTITNKRINKLENTASGLNLAGNILKVDQLKLHDPDLIDRNDFSKILQTYQSFTPTRIRRDASKQIISAPSKSPLGINLPNRNFSDIDPITSLMKGQERDKSPFQKAARNLMEKELR